MSLTFAQILRAAHTSPYVITSESAAYLVLFLAEQCGSSSGRPDQDSARLESGGGIHLIDTPRCEPHETDRALRQMLKALLAAAASPPDGLRAVIAGTPTSPDAFRKELAAALIPLNRAAARRALSRLYRRVETAATRPAYPPNGTQGRPSHSSAEQRPPAEPPSAEPLLAEPPSAEPPSAEERPPMAPTPAPTVSAFAETETAEPEWERAGWHSVRNTPCQFTSHTAASIDGTPFLGSLEVRARDAWPGTATETEQPSSGESATQVGAGDEPDPRMKVEPDTVVDVSVIYEPHFRQFNARRSEVGKLVEQFSAPSSPAEDEVRGALMRLADAETLNPGTVTPPPVAQELRSAERQPPPRPFVRKILLAGFVAVGLAMASNGLWFRSAAAPAGSLAFRAELERCAATIRVVVPEQAFVYLNDDRDRAEQSGPIAQFDQVSCDSQPELTVRVTSPSSGGPTDAWVRLPLPELELRQAAAQGQPLTISPLGD